MDEDQIPNVIHLDDVRQKKTIGGDPFFSFEFRDDLAEDGAPVGYTSGVVTVVLDQEHLTGIALSPKAAREFAIILIECAKLAEMETQVHPQE
jgi:hypothetical protein